MASAAKPKSILKNPTTTILVPTKEERHRETALYHANLIQQRKDLEYQIVLSIERMIDFPTVPNHAAENPAREDVLQFKTLLRPFQPTDYDSLIEERNICEHCGYTLCPKARVKGRHRVIGSGKGKDFRVLSKEELDKWCSDDCAKRALYVRVQLSERPAWERGTQTATIELLDELKTEEEKRQAQLLQDMRNLQLGETEKLEKAKRDLALERGDRGVTASNGLVDVSIQGKEVTKATKPPSFDMDNLDGQLDEMHLKMEGYTPKFKEYIRLEHHDEHIDSPDDGNMDEDSGMDWFA